MPTYACNALASQAFLNSPFFEEARLQGAAMPSFFEEGAIGGCRNAMLAKIESIKNKKQ
jgi:hypothetical protein